jgi:mRNA-degrading endonuclease RelE of RelBE toxin-antitoxin system
LEPSKRQTNKVIAVAQRPPRLRSYSNKFKDKFINLSHVDRERVKRALDDISRDPGKGKQLQGRPIQWSWRIGDLRVVYEFTNDTIFFVTCGLRRNVYDS